MIGWPLSANQPIDFMPQRQGRGGGRSREFGATALLALGLGATATQAAELYAGSEVRIRWDNTLKYSAAWRIADPALALVFDPNADAGDRNFSRGLISNRVDLLSELGIAAGNLGAELSAAGWYDTVYNQLIAPNTSLPPSFYPIPPTFAPAVRDLHGRKIDLLNAFAYDSIDIGGHALNVRVGRHTLLWGESLFFANNGIAAGQAPIDGIKAAAVPAVRAQEVFMPVNQISATFQANDALVVAGYYQFEWRRTRIPGVGSYFSAANFLDAGGSRLYVARNQYLTRTADAEPPDGGQFGLSLRGRGGTIDWGLYALRFHARDPQIYLRPTEAPASTAERALAYGYTPGIVGAGAGPGVSGYPFGVGLPAGAVGAYTLVYPRGIEVYGASFSGYLGTGSIAGEVSVRRNMPFVSRALVVTSEQDRDAIIYPKGTSLHGQFSYTTTLGPGRLWRSADLALEVATNHRLGIAANAAALDPDRTPFAASVRVVFEPRYFAVRPGVDLSLPISIGHGIAGRSSIDGSQDSRIGDVSVGITAVYRTVWLATVSVTRFLGDPRRQPFADRDFVALSIQRTF